MRDPNGPPVNLDGAGSGGGAAAAAAAAAAERVVHPIEKGSIVDWDVLEACLDHVLYDRVSLATSGGALLLLLLLLLPLPGRRRL